MDLDNISELLKILEKTTFSKIELEVDNIHLSVEKSECRNKSENNNLGFESISVADIEDNIEKVTEENIKIIKAPMVGVFFTVSNQSVEPFVKKGDVIKKGDTIGIIEAMKLMNEVVSDFDGEVVEICSENNSTVEYGQPIIKVKVK